MTDKPYWWPQLPDAEWRERIREDYPEKVAGWSDDEIDDYFNEAGCKYVDVWDHVGDARCDYENLADAFLSLVEETGKKPSDFIKE